MYKYLIYFSLLIFSANAQAFTLMSGDNPDMKGWSNPKIELMVNRSNCPANIDVVGIIKDAAAVWNNVPTSRISVSYGGSTTRTALSSPTVVYCETDFYNVVHADQDYVPGAAIADYTSGEIKGGVLYLNVSSGRGNIANFDRDGLTIILAHEIGHILGLGHSESTSALMYFDGTERTHLSLSQDDIDGVSYLYPRDELGGDKMMGCALVKNPPPPPGGFKGMFLLMLFLPLIAWAIARAKKA